MKHAFSDFKIGERFKVVDSEGKPFSSLLGQHDVVIKIHTGTQEVEGNHFIAHYSACRLIQEQPDNLKNKFKL